VYVAYLDDAGSTGGNLADKQSPFQVVASVLFAEADDFSISEFLLGNIIDTYVPEEMRDSFEFHASDLWACREPFNRLQKTQAVKITEQCFDLIQAAKLPISYGAVDKPKLSSEIFSTANPIDMAFRLCVEGLEGEMVKQKHNELVILVCDDSKSNRNAIRNAFRQYRRKIRSLQKHNRGKLAHVVDDIFFGDSSESMGIQIADMCCFAIERHLRQQDDTEYLYKAIEGQIYSGRIFP
jgi:hypothetical protein